MKTFFRLLPVPLVPRLFHDPLLQSLQLPEDKRVDAVQGLCFALPAPHLSCLRFLMHLLAYVADHSPDNRMNARNLSVVLTPSLIRLKTGSKLMNQEELRALPLQTALVEYLIEHAHLIGAMTLKMHEQSLRLAETTLLEEKAKRDRRGRSAKERVRVARAVLGLVADLHFRPNSCSSVSDRQLMSSSCTSLASLDQCPCVYFPSPTHYSDQETDGRMYEDSPDPPTARPAAWNFWPTITTQKGAPYTKQLRSLNIVSEMWFPTEDKSFEKIRQMDRHSDGRHQMSGHESDGIYEESVTDLQQQLEMMHVGISNSLPQVPVDSHGHQTPQNAVSEASAKGKLVTFRNFPSEYFSISMPEQGLGNMQYVPAQTGSSNETMLSEAETRSASQSTQDTLPYRANESLGSVSVCSERVVQQNYNPNRTASNESTTLYTRQGGQGDYACSKSSSSSSSWNSFRSVAQEPYNPSRIESSDSVFSGYSAQCVAGYAADAKGSHSDQRQKVSTSNNALTADSGSDDEGFDYRGSSCSSTEAGSKDINVLNTVDGNVRTATVDLDQHAPA
nr:hypothetical protein BaRGS_007196 [Batillaria attramentaria]